MQLYPCPKCGSRELKEWESVYLGSTVQCKNCGWREPSGFWNKRNDPVKERLKLVLHRALDCLNSIPDDSHPCYREIREALRIAEGELLDDDD